MVWSQEAETISESEVQVTPPTASLCPPSVCKIVPYFTLKELKQKKRMELREDNSVA